MIFLDRLFLFVFKPVYAKKIWQIILEFCSGNLHITEIGKNGRWVESDLNTTRVELRK